MKASKLIAVDWGTSHLRAYLCEVSTNAQLKLEQVKLASGVSKVEKGFEHELFHCISPWLQEYGELPILLAGQIGSSIGWRETEYLPSPVTPSDIASKCLTFSAGGTEVSIVPGVSCQHTNGVRDVMRGEELQVLGWLQLDEKHKQGEHLICLPGTHTKWVKVTNGKINVFKTALTGELYDLLSNQSVLIQQQSKENDFESFDQGVLFTLKSSPGSFVHGLFSVRSKQLFDELTPIQAQSYLSGLLIGSDVRAALNAEEWQLKEVAEVSIIGSSHLAQSFAHAIQLAGIFANVIDEQQATLSGFGVVYQLRSSKN